MERSEEMGRMEQRVTRVLFCGPFSPASHNYTREYLSNYPFIQVDVVPIEDVPNVIGNYHICVVKNMQMNSSVVSRAKQMKLIMQFGVGLEGVDVDAATKHGIKVARIPGESTGNAASCAEMAVYLMLGLLRKQSEMQNSIKLKKLGEPVGETLFGKTVFIIGFGSIGLELAKRLKPFDVRILSTKRSWTSYSQDPSQSDGLSVQNDAFDDLVDEKGSHDDIYKFASLADIIVCCLSLNRETAGIINESFFSSMKKGAYLVNIARGGLLKYDAVVHNLESGHLGGLGIDVAWTEPFDPNDPILKFQNVIMTPHVAGVTEHSYRSAAKVVGDVALQLHEGVPLTGVEFVN
ncbi:hypothetical protein Nepgr_023619 [Nepenthes gracilis]|uniref:Uncharacterized protein n=1 Tax=Nepenthes gracilis TaxID=150966 RepID=A0AAD3XXV8_NEPGR|nr:hypothetical protein Nepgr_023619 [Nepenthes gracilis]